MEVRRCSPCDLELLREHWPTSDDVAGAHYEQQETGHATFLVGWRGAQPWGSALIKWQGCVGENARAAFPDCVEVNHLHVRPPYRGRGTGTAILTAAEQHARDRGVSLLGVSVGLKNTDAAKLYRRLNYLPTGVVDEIAYRWRDDQGAWHDEVESDELLVKYLEKW